MRKIFPLIFILTIFLSPVSALAQTSGGGSAGSQGGTYNPSSTTTSGSTFQGNKFSGVGGAVAGCLNIGGLISSGVSAGLKELGIGGGSSDGGKQEVPAKDSSTQKELKTANKISQCLDGVAYAVAKKLLQQVVNKTINWANTGFNGNPLYVRDINSYLTSIRDEKVSQFLTRIPNQDPIFGNAIRSVVTQEITGRSDGLINQVMDTPQARQYADFQKDFTKGGWDTFLNESNNPISAVFKAADQLGDTVNNAQQNVKDQLQRNNGFLDMQKCAEYSDGAAGNGGGAESQGGVGGGGADSAPGTATTGSTRATPVCLRYETVTPGSVIAGQVNNVVNSTVRQLEQADKINEVVGAFFDQLLNKLFTSGLQSLGGRSRNASGTGMGSNVVIGTNGLPLSSVSYAGAQDALGYQSSAGSFDQEFDISRPQQLRAVIKTQLDFINRSRDAQVAMHQIVPVTGALDYCFPGPNPTWSDGIDNNYETFWNSMVTPDPQSQSTLVQIIRRILDPAGVFGSLFSQKTFDNAVAGIPSLYDKVTESNKDMGLYSLVSTRKKAVRDDFGVYFQVSYDDLLKDYKKEFTKTAFTNAFVAIAGSTAEQDYAKGFVNDTLKETGNLVGYSKAITNLDDIYNESISDTEDVVRELTTIDAEIEQIVAVAKARYIQEQAAAGTPVNLACINEAYDVSTAPITGVARQESDTPSDMERQSNDARVYFYSHLY